MLNLFLGVQSGMMELGMQFIDITKNGKLKEEIITLNEPSLLVVNLKCGLNI